MLEKIVKKMVTAIETTNDPAEIACASMALGLATGSIGQLVGGKWELIIPAVPPAMDLIAGRPSYYTIPYAMGAAVPYLLTKIT